MHVIEFKGKGDPCDYFYFSGGEPHAKVPTILDDDVYVRVHDMTWEDYGHLLCLLSALNTQHKTITLAIPYFPGARQDRNPGGNSPATCEMYAMQLAPLAEHIIVCDAHSSLALAHMNAHAMLNYGKLTHITADEIFALWKQEFEHITHVIAPDRGAQDRASRVAEVLGVPVITCEKVREFNTGYITSYDIQVDQIEPGEYLVVDDICDGGATFNILASSFWDKVEPNGTKVVLSHDLYLYVTHPIFSKGFEELYDQFEHIYTTNSRNFIYPSDDYKLTVLDIDPLLKGVIENELHVQH